MSFFFKNDATKLMDIQKERNSLLTYFGDRSFHVSSSHLIVNHLNSILKAKNNLLAYSKLLVWQMRSTS